MIDTSPPPRKLKQLIFGGNVTNQDSIEEDLDKIDMQRSQDGNSRPSAYVSVFEEMVRTVAKTEGDLLTEQEINLLDSFGQLSYNLRYCLVRLVLRKADQWHPVSALEKYGKEIGPEYVLPAITDLCKPIKQLLQEKSSEINVKVEQVDPLPSMEDEREFVDLTMNSDDEDVKPVIEKPDIASVSGGCGEASTSRLSTNEDRLRALLEPFNVETEPDRFCEDESVMTTNEILGRLSNPQLKILSAEMGCKFKSNLKKSDMIYKLQCNAATQTVLHYGIASPRKGKGKADGLVQSRLPFSFAQRTSFSCKTRTTQEDHLKTKALQLLGKCIRVRNEFYQLVRHLHIICYRETEHPTSLLLPALLTTFKKRDYTGYTCTRSNKIWSSREELLEYERALELESLLDDLIEAPEDKSRRKTTKTPSVRVKDKFITPATSAIGASSATPLITPGSISNIRSSKTPGIKKEEDIPIPNFSINEADVDGSLELEISKEEQIKSHFETWIYPKWQQQLAQRKCKGAQSKLPGLERFESGHVFTRMVHKCTNALGTLKEYKAELKIINDLLSQSFWRRGKRSVWYERRAIILGHLTRQAVSKEAKEELLLETLEGVKLALRDEETTLVHRPGLVKRLLSLEAKLGIPIDERSQSDGKLEPAPERTLVATRVQPSHYDALGKENTEIGLRAYISVTKSTSGNTGNEALPLKKKLGQKSRWKGRNDQIVNVETRALEYYEDQGFKGFHCETKILTTIFGLLFWDIIFANVPGAFETSYQVAPLDMFDETFKDARKGLIQTRLEEIRNGGWREIVERHDNAYREKKTWCIGVSWDLCNKEDFLDILECFGGKSLATICQHFCDDYKGRSSGGPDLFIWKVKDGDQPGVCKFVEVKGPGDHPQANQRVWFDCLHRANVTVEICWVRDISHPQKDIPSSKKRKAKATSTTSRRKKNPQAESISEEEDYDRLDPEPEEDLDFASSNPPVKRQRISPQDYKLAPPEGVVSPPPGNEATPSRASKVVKMETTRP